MKDKLLKIRTFTSLKELPGILRSFLKDESISGKLILIAAVLSLLVVNSSLRAVYDTFWHQDLSIGFTMDLRHWVNEGLMAFFFLVVGLEIKRELVSGELRNLRVAALPIGAAVGGMIIPALVYLLFNTQADTIRGWGIPIATDIAFAVAILSLLGRRVPLALKLFLLTLAIADDIGAILVIALFYAEIIHYGYLATSVALLLFIFLVRKRLENHLLIFMAGSVILWATTHLSGIHASIVGAAIGLLAPLGTDNSPRAVAHRLEKMFLPFSTFVVLPLFAFANAGVVLSGGALADNSSVLLGIVLGLVAGKAIGITLASWLLVRLKIAQLPADVSWRHIIGVSFIAGIGFTVSIFITELAFSDNQSLIDAAKISIIIASVLSAAIGALILLTTKRIVPKL